MFLRHPHRRLSAYLDGELDPQADRDVRSHLEKCPACRRRHDRIAAGARWAEILPSAPAPDQLLGQIERRFWTPEPAAGWGRRLSAKRLGWALAATAVVAILLAILEGGRSKTASLELRGYFAEVAQARAARLAPTIAAAPSGFTSVPKAHAFRQAGLELAPPGQPLQGFDLVAHRARPMLGADATELVYSGGGEAFSLFVAPKSMPLRPAAADLAETRVGGSLCHKLEPSCATVVWFSGGRFQCVLVSTFDDPRKISAVIDYFRAAHDAESRRRSG
jgi:anti-sigma factor RsiW